MRDATRTDHATRIARVVDHIWAHLDAPLTLGRLAEIACLSPYHFHRVYRAADGLWVDRGVQPRFRGFLRPAARQMARGADARNAAA